MVSTAAAMIAVALIAVVGLFFVFGGASIFVNSPQGQSVVNVGADPTPNNPVATSKTNLGAGDRVTVTNTYFDTISRGALAETTNAVNTLLRSKDGAQFGITPVNNNPYYTVAATGNSQTIQLVEADNGLITLTIEAASGQKYLVDIAEFVSANPGIVERYAFYDWDDDGDRQYVIQVNTKFLKPIEQTENVPVLNLQVPLSNEATISLNAPSDQTSLGTSATTITIYWEATGTSQDVTFWRHVALTVNQTSVDEFDQQNSYFTLDGQRYNLIDADDNGAVGSNYTWKHILSTNIGEAPFHKFTVASGTKAYITTVLKIDLDTADTINITLEVSTWDAELSPNTAVTDTVKIAA